MANQQVNLANAYVLHTRSFRENSMLVDAYTRDHGLVRIVAKGAKGSNGNAKILQPFIPLLLSYSGNGELYTLRLVEQLGASFIFYGQRLLSGLYINELLLSVITFGDPQPQLYCAYETCLVQLEKAATLAYPLRIFEKNLLEILGYGIDFYKDVNGRNIEPAANYRFVVRHGFMPAKPTDSDIIDGNSILALRNEQLDEFSLKVAKKIFKQALEPYIGKRELQSTALWV